MILDHLDNLTLPDGHHFGNEVAVLQSLAVGLDFLSTQIAGIEKEAWRRFANKARVLSVWQQPDACLGAQGLGSVCLPLVLGIGLQLREPRRLAS
jgi:hypothetical protein